MYKGGAGVNTSLFDGMDSGRIDIVVNEVEVSEERKAMGQSL